MALKQCIEILLEEMKRIDALTEADMQAYAGFVANVEKHTANIDRRKRELRAFEKMFGALAEPSVYGENSRHVGLLNNMIAEEQAGLDRNNERINERKEYYEQLSGKGSHRLWKLGDDSSRQAALYFAYGADITDISEMSAEFLKDSDAFSEAIAKYFIIKNIICYENKNENPKDDLAALYQLAMKFGKNKQDTGWQNIITALEIYQARLCFDKCNETIRKNENALDRHNAAIDAYKRNSDKVKSQIDDLEPAKCGREVKEEVKKVRNWFEEQTKEWNKILANISSYKQEIETNQHRLNEIKKKIEAELENGLSEEMVREIHEQLEELEKSSSRIRSSLYEKPEKRASELLEGLKEAVKPVRAAKNTEDARKKEEAKQEVLRGEQRRERKEERRRNRPANLRTCIACLFVVFTMLLGPIGANGWANVTYSSPRPVPFTVDDYVYYRSTGPVVFGLGISQYLIVSIQTEEIPKFITPFIHQYGWNINNENVTQVDVPDEVDVLTINSFFRSEDRKALDSDLMYLAVSTNESVKQINLTRMRERMVLEFDGRISLLDENNTEHAYIDGAATLRRNIQGDYGPNPQQHNNGIYLDGPQVLVHNISLDDVTQIVANKGVERLCITECDTVTDIYLSENVKYVEIRNCDNLVNIHWPEGIDMSQVEVHIGDNGSNVATEEGM